MRWKLLASVCLMAALAQAGVGPKGHLVIIGGGGSTPAIDRAMVDLAGGTNAVLLAITTAGGTNGFKAGEGFVKHFSKLGAASVKWAQPTRAESDDPQYVEKLLKGVTGIFFTGGSQRRITTEHRGTLLHRKMLELYENGGMISGSSAGAAMMSDPMITGTIKGKPVVEKNGQPVSDVFRSIAKDQVETVGGMGFIKGAIIDQHFVKRGRENRLFSVALENPSYTCFGLDESTAIVVSNGNQIKVLGKSNVIAIPPRKAPIKTNRQGDFGTSELKISLLLEGDTWKLEKIKN